MADTQAPDKYEFYRRVMLPIMGLAEVIGTQGRSPGVTAQRSMQQFDTAESQRNTAAEEAKRTAMEGEVFGMKKGEYLAQQEERAKNLSYQKALGIAESPEDKRGLALDEIARTNPDLFYTLTNPVGEAPPKEPKIPGEQAPKTVFANPQQLEAYVDRVAQGFAKPDMSDLSARGAAGARARIEAQEILRRKYPGFDPQREIAAYTYWNSPSNMRQRQVMDVVTEQLPKLQKASSEMKRLGVPALDMKYIENMRATGNVAAAKYLASLYTTVEDIAKGIAGGNALTDDQLKLANEILYKKASILQIDALVQSVREGVESRKATMYNMGGLQARRYAKTDKYLSPRQRKEILNEAEGGEPGKKKATKQWNQETGQLESIGE